MPTHNGRPTIKERILALLSDGMPHSRFELLACLEDPEASLQNMQVHLSQLRKPIRLRGEDIICELFDGKLHYRHIRLLRWPIENGEEKAQQLMSKTSPV